MSKLPKHILLPSAESGWQLWRSENELLSCVENFPDPAKLITLPLGTRIAFSSHNVAALPLIILSDDILIQKGIAKLKLEQSGILKKENDSWDMLAVSKEDSLYTGAVLLNTSGLLAKYRVDQSFDVAARYYEVGDIGTVLCKKEQGRWVSIFYKNSKPFYWEAIDSIQSLPSQLKTLMIEFSQREIPFILEKLIIEADANTAGNDVHDDLITRLEQDLNVEVEQIEEVNRVQNSRSSLSLVPEAVKLARQKRIRNNKIKLFVLLLLCLYVIMGMILYQKNIQLASKINQLKKESLTFQPAWEKYQSDLSKVNSLDNILTNQWPLASFEKIVSHLPEHQELRFQVVEIQANAILIKGISPNINLINALYPALTKDSYFGNYRWRMPAPVIEEETKLWNFTIEATKKGDE